MKANRDQWNANPIAAFDAFVQSKEFAGTRRKPRDTEPKPIARKSAAIYRYMFRKFVRWIDVQGKPFSQVEEQDLVRFVGQIRRRGEQDSDITERYLLLLERCYKHLRIAPNPASAAHKLAKDNKYLGKNQGTEVLSSAQIEAFIAALPPFEPVAPNRAGRPPKSWKRRRDHAMQATMLYSGLHVAEAIGLHLDEVDDPFSEGPIRLQINPAGKHDTSYEHETLVLEYGAAALRRWLIERQSVDREGKRILEGDLVFPGDHVGKPMTRLTVYRQVKATFERAGIDVNRSGGRTLRNTFAKQAFDGGLSIADLTERLGLALERSTNIYVTATSRESRSDEDV